MRNKFDHYIQTRVKVKGSGIEFMFVAVYGIHKVHDRLNSERT